MKEECEAAAVAVIGGGPAGSSTAIALARQGIENVVVFDAGEGERHHPAIGESIPPAATPALLDLGVFEEVLGSGHLRCPGSQSVWGSPEPGYNDFLFDASGAGHHLDRRAFDTALLAAAERSGAQVVRSRRFKDCVRRGTAFALTFTTPEGDERIHRADFVVDATGSHAAFARRLRVARNLMDQLLSVCAIVEVSPGDVAGDSTFLEAVERGWWYGARLPGGMAILSFTSDRETLKRCGLARVSVWRDAYKRTCFISTKLSPAALSGPLNLIVKAAPVMILSTVVGRDWIAVGDAASAYDPIGSAGITKALQDGLAAGSVIAGALGGDGGEAVAAYQGRVFAAFTSHLKLRQSLYAAEMRWPSAGFWRRRRRGGA